MSISKLLIKSSFILLVMVSLQSSQAKNEYVSGQQTTKFDEIKNIVDPSEIIGTEVLIKDLGLSNDELTFH